MLLFFPAENYGIASILKEKTEKYVGNSTLISLDLLLSFSQVFPTA